MDKLIEGRDYTIVDGVLTVNEGVTRIPTNTFCSNNDITSIILPSTLVTIEEHAFSYMKFVKKVVIPDNVRSIHDYAFALTLIDTLVLGKNLIYIGSSAFYSCAFLENIINNSKDLKIIKGYAFAECPKLSNFPNLLASTYIVDNSFSNTPFDSKLSNCNSSRIFGSLELTKPEEHYSNSDLKDTYSYNGGILRIHEGVEIVGDFSKLKDCTRVEMPDSVVIIDFNAFKGLNKLESVRFSNNITEILDYAFGYCALKNGKLYLPDSLCYMSYSAFSGNYNKDLISVPESTFIKTNFDMNNYGIYEKRNYEMKDNEYNYFLSVSSLLEEDKNKLNKLELLPETIRKNRSLANIIDKSHSEILSRAIFELLKSDNYNEEIEISIIKNILETKEINVCNIHEVVNNLFINGQINTIYLLISYGYNYLDNCMISKAILYDMYEMIDILLLLGANIDEIGDLGTTPLSIACKKGDISLVKHLIEKGASIGKTDRENKKAIDYAIENNYIEIVNLFNSYSEECVSETELDIMMLSKLLDNL